MCFTNEVYIVKPCTYFFSYEVLYLRVYVEHMFFTCVVGVSVGTPIFLYLLGLVNIVVVKNLTKRCGNLRLKGWMLAVLQVTLTIPH